MSAPGSVAGGTINVGSNLVLAGNTVSADVIGGSQLLTGSVTGYNGGIASNVDLTLSNPSGFSFSDFSTMTGNVNILAGDFSFQNGIVVDRVTITNPSTRVLIDQHDRSLQPFDVQLYTGSASFSFRLFTNHVSTNSLIINHGPMHEVSDPAGPSISAVDQGYQALALAASPAESARDEQEQQESDSELVRFTGIPVNIEQ
jgi:hypothetical protein